MAQELDDLVRAIRSIPLDDRLSDEAAVALSGCYISMRNLAVAGPQEPEWGSVGELESALDTLFGICRKRCRGRQTLARRSRLIPVMHDILRIPGRVFDERRFGIFCDCADKAVGDWMEMVSASPGVAEQEPVTECGILRCIIDMFSYAPAVEREADEWFLYLKRRVAEWSSGIGEGCMTDAVTDEAALCRLNVIALYSNSFPDSAPDVQLAGVRNLYGGRISENVHPSAEAVSVLYELMMWGAVVPDYDGAGMLAERARVLAGRSEPCDDAWLTYMSVYVGRHCMRSAEEFRNRLLAHSA